MKKDPELSFVNIRPEAAIAALDNKIGAIADVADKDVHNLI